MQLATSSIQGFRFAIAIMLIAASDTQAGEPVITTSSIPGYFFGVHGGGDALLAVSAPQISAVKNACARKARIWGLNVSTTFRCTHFEYVRPPKELAGAESPFFALDIQADELAQPATPPAIGGLSLYGEGMQLFSLKPFPAYKWESRHATQGETRGVTALFAKDEPELQHAQQAFSSGNVMVLDAPNRKATVFLVRLEEHEQAEYGGGNPRYAAVIKQNGKFRKTCEVEGYISGVVDLDGDGIPELHVTTECDGNCESVISLTENCKRLISTD